MQGPMPMDRPLWGGTAGPGPNAWGRGACPSTVGGLPDMPKINCALVPALKLNECDAKCPGGCNNGYCDCGRGACVCKAGFSGTNCDKDVCAAARCGAHGRCTGRYLGGDAPPTAKTCVCESPWTGPLCDRNPCADAGEKGKCSGHGTCVAVGDSAIRCQCDGAYSGTSCDKTCAGFCKTSTFPFGCAPDVGDKALYCATGGGCRYEAPTSAALDAGQFCCYKNCPGEGSCGAEGCPAAPDDCHRSGACVVKDGKGTCGVATALVDGTFCNSQVGGLCKAGMCVGGDGGGTGPSAPSPSGGGDGGTTPSPSSSPSLPPSPSTSGGATPTPALAPAPAPKATPPASTCSDACLNGGTNYSCRGRIDWLVRLAPAKKTLEAALTQINAGECAGQCRCTLEDFGVFAPSPASGTYAPSPASSTYAPSPASGTVGGDSGGNSGGSSGVNAGTGGVTGDGGSMNGQVGGMAMGVIIGAAAGGGVCVIILILAVVLLVRRRSRRHDESGGASSGKKIPHGDVEMPVKVAVGGGDGGGPVRAAAGGGWDTVVDENTGDKYYHNPMTGETAWELPQ